MKAIWNGAVIAESDDTIVVEGNHYFPRESLVDQHFSSSGNRSVCHWKGTASYFHVEVDGKPVEVTKDHRFFEYVDK